MENKKPYKSRRVPLWLPYLKEMSVDKKGVGHFIYNGGEEHENLDDISTIMIYGENEATLYTTDIEKIARKGIPIVYHRRHIASNIYITSGLRPDPEDCLTKQILAREDENKTKHIARSLLNAKFHSSTWLVGSPPKLSRLYSIKKLRNIEAQHAKKYWAAYFELLGYSNYTRRGDNPISQALDANSKFVSSVILRWISYHHLSPFHGYLHEQSSYPSLVYDLFEPYRSMYDYELFKAVKLGGVNISDSNKVTALAISLSKDMFAQKQYVPLTRQIVSNMELLHGVVLSLKYYLLGNQKRFLVPLPGKPNGGRPPKVNFLLYGRHAGKTDFWQEAAKASKKLL